MVPQGNETLRRKHYANTFSMMYVHMCNQFMDGRDVMGGVTTDWPLRGAL